MKEMPLRTFTVGPSSLYQSKRNAARRGFLDSTILTVKTTIPPVYVHGLNHLVTRRS